MKLLRLNKWLVATWQFCAAFPSCSVVHGSWLAFMQLIRRKVVRGKACITASCCLQLVRSEKRWGCGRACPPATRGQQLEADGGSRSPLWEVPPWPCRGPAPLRRVSLPQSGQGLVALAEEAHPPRGASHAGGDGGYLVQSLPACVREAS